MQTVGSKEGLAKRDFAPGAERAQAPLLRIEGLTKRFGGQAAVDDLSLAIYPGEFFALLGPSGCGKTTLLRLIAGFERAGAGRILLDGIDLLPVPPHRRPVNMMFQSYALFPHLTVAGNVAFGLKQEGLPKAHIAERVAEMLALVRLQDFAARKPHELSGGQRQRVALARSLAKRPRILLLDEPMAALDKKLRGETQFELMELQRRLGLTFIIVTHDQSEAMTVADRIAVMDRGHLMQVGPPAEIYERPNSRWVADFIGEVNLLEGRVREAGPSATVVETPDAGLVRAAPCVDAVVGATVWVALRPEKIDVALAPPQVVVESSAANENCVAGEVTGIGYLGDLSLYQVRLDGGATIKASLANVRRQVDQPIRPLTRVWLTWANDAGVVLTK